MVTCRPGRQAVPAPFPRAETPWARRRQDEDTPPWRAAPARASAAWASIQAATPAPITHHAGPGRRARQGPRLPQPRGPHRLAHLQVQGNNAADAKIN